MIRLPMIQTAKASRLRRSTSSSAKWVSPTSTHPSNQMSQVMMSQVMMSQVMMSQVSQVSQVMMSQVSQVTVSQVSQAQVRLVLQIHLLMRRFLAVISLAPDLMISQRLSLRAVRRSRKSRSQSRSRTSSSTSNPKPMRSRVWAAPQSNSETPTGSAMAWLISLRL